MDVIFRGCTRPALVLGVPLVPLVAVIAPAAMFSVWLACLIGIYAWIWAAAGLVPVVYGLREMTRLDDQRLLQWVHLLRLIVARRSWHARSQRRYCPIHQSHS